VCERPRVRRGTRGRFNLCLPMKMAIVASTAPGNVWTTDEFAALVRENVTSLLNLGLAPVNGGRTDLALHRHVRYRLDGQNIRNGIQLADAYLVHRQQAAKALHAYGNSPTFSMASPALANGTGRITLTAPVNGTIAAHTTHMEPGTAQVGV
jgi:hypothetical protein